MALRSFRLWRPPWSVTSGHVVEGARFITQREWHSAFFSVEILIVDSQECFTVRWMFSSPSTLLCLMRRRLPESLFLQIAYIKHE